MKRSLPLIVVVAAVAGLYRVDAQTQSPAPNASVIVSGCVNQAQRTGSLADDNRAGVAATPNTAPIDANRAEPVDAYILTNATPLTKDPDRQTTTTPTSYALQGHEQELANHQGHRVEISGRVLPRVAPASPKTPAPGIDRIAVDSIKMLTADCPAKTK